MKAIVEEIKEAKYFSLSVDSTPDISHSDQMTVVIRCVGKSDHKVFSISFPLQVTLETLLLTLS